MAMNAQISPAGYKNLQLALANPNSTLDAQIKGALQGLVFKGKALAGNDNAQPYLLPREAPIKAVIAPDEFSIERARVAAALLQKEIIAYEQIKESTQSPKEGVLDVVAKGGTSPFVTARSALKVKNPDEQGLPKIDMVEEASGIDHGSIRSAVIKTDLGAMASLDDSHMMVAHLPTPGRAPLLDKVLSI